MSTKKPDTSPGVSSLSLPPTQRWGFCHPLVSCSLLCVLTCSCVTVFSPAKFCYPFEQKWTVFRYSELLWQTSQTRSKWTPPHGSTSHSTMCSKTEICHFFYTSLLLSAELLPRQKYPLFGVRFSPTLEQHMPTYSCVPTPPKSS